MTGDVNATTGREAEAVAAAVDPRRTTELLQRFVQTPSITGDEQAVAELIASELRSVGLDRVEVFEFAEGRPNVWGVLHGTGGGSSVMFLGHHDTVHVEGWREQWLGTERESPFGATIVDGELWGRGAADQKAGVVSVIGALRALSEAGARPRGDVVVAFVGDEESGQPGSGLSDGMKAVAARISTGEIPRADFAVYTEPTTLDVYAAQMGFIIAELTVIGKSSYFGKPWLGVDALREAHGLLADLFAHSERIGERREHPLIGRAFLLVYAIEGGGYIAVPDRCTLTLILKVLPGEALDEAGSELEALVRAFEERAGVQVRLRYTASRDHPLGGTPAEVSPDLPAIEPLRRAVAVSRGREPVISGAPYWSEVSFLHTLGIPAVYCGPGDITYCHTSMERVPVAEVIDGATAFARFVCGFCGFDGGGPSG